MASETSSYQVIYKALADFSAFSKAAKGAQKDLKELKAAEKDYNDSVVSGSAKSVIAREANIRSIGKEQSAMEKATTAVLAHAAAAAEDAAATRADAEAHSDLAQATAYSNKVSREKSNLPTLGGSSNANGSTQQAGSTQVMTNAAKLAASAMKTQAEAEADTEAVTIELAGATKDATKSIENNTTARKNNTSEVAKARTVVEQAKRGQHELDDEYKAALDVMAKHSRAINTDAVAARKRLNVSKDEQKVNKLVAASVGLLSGVLGTLGAKASEAGLEDLGSTLTKLGGKTTDVTDAFQFMGSGIVSAGKGAIGALGGLAGGIVKIVSLISLIGPLVAILGAASSAAVGLGTAIVSIGGLALTAAPGLAALATAGGALVLAFHGVGAVFKAYGAQQKAAGVATANASDLAYAATQRLHTLQEAEHSLAEAQGNVLTAQLSLNDARKQAVRDLEDLRAAVKKGPADEESAIAALDKAKEEYKQALVDPSKSKADTEQAKAAVDQAKADLDDVRTKNKRNKDDLATADKKGIEGAPGVVAAKKQVADANYNVVKAQWALADAQHAVAKGDTSATTAANAYQDALNKLSPKAQEFVKGLIAQKAAWEGLKRATQDAFFGHIVGDLGRLLSMVPVLTGLFVKQADALGTVADQGIRMVTSGPWKKDFATLGDRNAKLTITFGKAVLALLDVFRNLVLAAGPALQRLADGFLKASQWLDQLVKTSRDNGKLADWLTHIGDRAGVLWDAIKNVAAGFLSLAHAAGGFNDDMLGGLDKLTKKFRDWATEQDKPGSKFKTYLVEIKPLLHEVGGLVGDIVKAFGGLGSNTTNIDKTTDFVKQLRKMLPEVIGFITQVATSDWLKTITEIAGHILDIVNSLQSMGFLSLLTNIGQGLGVLATVVSGMATITSDFIKLIDKIPGMTGVVNALGKAIGVLIGLAFIAKVTKVFKMIGAIQAFRSRNDEGGPTRTPGRPGRPGRSTSGDDDTPAAPRRKRTITNPLGRPARTPAEPRSTSRTPALPSVRGSSGYMGILEVMLVELRKIVSLLGGVPGTGHGNNNLGDDGKKDDKRSGGRHRATAEDEPTTRTGRFRSRVSDRFKRVRAGGDRGSFTIPGRASSTAVREAESLGEGELGNVGRFGKVGGLLSKFGKVGGEGRLASGLRGGLAGAAIGIGGGLLLDKLTPMLGKAGKSVNEIGQGALQGAGIGATIGSLVPGVGTVVGGAVGGVVGGTIAALKDPKIRKALDEFFTKTLPKFLLVAVKELDKIWHKILDVLVWPFVHAWRAIQTAWNAVTSAIETAFHATVDFVVKIGEDILAAIVAPYVLAWKAVTTAWDKVSAAISVAYHATLRAFKTGWNTLRSAVTAPIRLALGGVKTAWSNVRGVFNSAVTWVRSTFAKSWNGLKSIITGPVDSAKRTVSTTLGTIRTAFTDLKTKVIDTVTGLKNSIGPIWNQIKKIFGEPVWFVVHSIINPLISGAEVLLSHLGINIPQIPENNIPHYRTGGVIPGHHDRDDVAIYATPGEVMVPKNRVAAFGGPRALMKMLGFSGTEASPGSHHRLGLPNPINVVKAVGSGIADVATGAYDATKDFANAAAGFVRKGAAAALDRSLLTPLRNAAGALDNLGPVGSGLHNLVNETLGAVKSFIAGKEQSTDTPPVPATNNQLIARGYAGGGEIAALLGGAGLAGPGGSVFEMQNRAAAHKLATVSNHTSSSSVDRGITIQHLEIKNPRQEQAGDSISRSVSKINFFAGRG